jgi:lipopolysaccharide transport system ATP-binding protein
VVDEVLAVGDAEFQKKAIGKMQDVSQGEGRTVLFVSHNMAAVQNLCKSGIVLENGSGAFTGTAKESIDFYLKDKNDAGNIYENAKPNKTDMNKIEVLDTQGENRSNFGHTEQIVLRFNVSVEQKYFDDLHFGFRLQDQRERVVFTVDKPVKSILKKAGNYDIAITVPAMLVPNQYYIIPVLHIPNKEIVSYLEYPVQFAIEEIGTEFSAYVGNDYGCVFVDCKWELV